MRQLTQLRAMVDAALVERVAAFDARAGARYDGQPSTQAWLRSRLRLGGEVSDLVRVARQLAGLPQAAKAFAAGEISLEHASALARLAATVDADAAIQFEQILLDLARAAPPVKLRIACEHLRQLLDPDGNEDEAARQRRTRYVTAARTVGGMVHLQGLLDASTGDTVLTALAARCRCRRQKKSALPPSGAPTRSARSAGDSWRPARHRPVAVSRRRSTSP